MKQRLYILIFFLLLIATNASSQVRNVIVEKYYVSDSLDATDTIDGAALALPLGSKTYRIYVQLDSGYKLKKIYGVDKHPLRITSTANFYNNIDRAPNPYFGYAVGKNWFAGNPIMALDSWLTLGLCAKLGATNYIGVLKAEDTDGSLLNNGGGTAGVTGGLLVNNDTSAHISIRTSDGMMPDTATFGTWSDNGFRDLSNVDTTVFGTSIVGNQFISTSAYLLQNSGVKGVSIASNNVLVAQLTTLGDISFELNLELIDSLGATHNVIPNNNNHPTTGDTTVNGLLKYPPDAPVCGCKDPEYLEYNANYVCANNADSCIHRIVFGCMDTLACNYDATANFNLPSLCCYPGRCNDRDISLVCPGISTETGFSIYPNPVSNQLTLQIAAGNNQDVKYEIYDSYGTKIIEREMGVLSGAITQQVDVSNLHVGLYLVRLYVGTTQQSKSFMKN